jgi:chromosome segregation ATPase
VSILVDEGELAQMTAEHYLTTRKLEECQHRINELESLMQDQSFALAEARAASEHWKDAYNTALAGGDILKAEVERLKKQLANANAALLDFPVLLKELAEARAALREVHLTAGRFPDIWHKRHAAALKAAREAK